jgi:hypothetical protein
LLLKEEKIQPFWVHVMQLVYGIVLISLSVILIRRQVAQTLIKEEVSIENTNSIDQEEQTGLTKNKIKPMSIANPQTLHGWKLLD